METVRIFSREHSASWFLLFKLKMNEIDFSQIQDKIKEAFIVTLTRCVDAIDLILCPVDWKSVLDFAEAPENFGSSQIPRSLFKIHFKGVSNINWNSYSKLYNSFEVSRDDTATHCIVHTSIAKNVISINMGSLGLLSFQYQNVFSDSLVLLASESKKGKWVYKDSKNIREVDFFDAFTN